MSDVTTVAVVPDTTWVSIEEEVTNIVTPLDDVTQVVTEGEDVTEAVTVQDSTQITLGETVTVVVAQDETVVVGADAAGPQGPPGPPGPGGITETIVTAAVAISAGRIVTLEPDGAHYYDPTLAGYGKAVGMSKHAAAMGDDLAITTIGPVELVGMGFPAGQRYWAGSNGTLLTAPPNSGLVVPLGYAVDGDTFNVQIESYLVW